MHRLMHLQDIPTVTKSPSLASDLNDDEYDEDSY